MQAIFFACGKQYCVKSGDIVMLEKLDVTVGAAHTFDQVLCVIDGETTVVGKPYVSGAAVRVEIIGEGKEKKKIIFKYKAKKGYRRKRGHRQPFTRAKVVEITK